MPLPRPLPGPMALPSSSKDQDEQSRPTRRPRPVAPISASAFSFQLATPTKATRDVKREEVPLSTPSRYVTPLREVEPTTPMAGPSRAARPLNSLPSPYGGPAFKPRVPVVKLEHGTRMSDMVWGSAKMLGKRKETEMGEEEGKAADSPSKPMRALGQLGRVDLGENLHVEEVKKRVEEEGIGVSPRGKRIVKYSGKGPPPLSFMLNNALSSQQSSLVLFYASLQSTLFPRLTPRKTRITPSALTEGALKPLPKGPTVLQHLRTAPLVLQVEAMVNGRTGWSIMCRCEVVKGQVGQQELQSSKARAGDEPVKQAEDSETGQSGPQSDKEQEVLVILQPVPQDCARLGLDPRILILKPPDHDRLSYEIGIWPAWTDTILDDYLIHPTDDLPERSAKHHRVVFASRYLIAESTTLA